MSKNSSIFQIIQSSISTQFKCKYTLYFFNQIVLVQMIQFSISTGFICAQLNVKTVLYKANQFSVNTVSKSKTVTFQTIHFSISTQFKCKFGLIVKNISI